MSKKRKKRFKKTNYQKKIVGKNKIITKKTSVNVGNRTHNWVDEATFICNNFYIVNGSIDKCKKGESTVHDSMRNIHFLWMLDHALGGTWRKDFYELTKLCYDGIDFGLDKSKLSFCFALFYEEVQEKRMYGENTGTNLLNDVDETTLTECCIERATEFLGYNPTGSDDFSKEEVHKFYCTVLFCKNMYRQIQMTLSETIWFSREAHDIQNQYVSDIAVMMGSCYIDRNNGRRYLCLRCAMKAYVSKHMLSEGKTNFPPEIINQKASDEVLSLRQPTPYTNFMKLRLRDYKPDFEKLAKLNYLGYGETANTNYNFTAYGIVIWAKAMFIKGIRTTLSVSNPLNNESLSLHKILSRSKNYDGPMDIYRTDYAHLDPRCQVMRNIDLSDIDAILDEELLKYKDCESYDKLMEMLKILSKKKVESKEDQDKYAQEVRTCVSELFSTFIKIIDDKPSLEDL